MSYLTGSSFLFCVSYWSLFFFSLIHRLSILLFRAFPVEFSVYIVSPTVSQSVYNSYMALILLPSSLLPKTQLQLVPYLRCSVNLIQYCFLYWAALWVICCDWFYYFFILSLDIEVEGKKKKKVVFCVRLKLSHYLLFFRFYLFYLLFHFLLSILTFYLICLSYVVFVAFQDIIRELPHYFFI